MSNMVKALLKNVGGYNVTKADIEKYGGIWNDDYAVYLFPDGAMGAFTDMRQGAQERDARGEPVFHFVEFTR